jgi:methionyl-tRNA formyltransferase
LKFGAINLHTGLSPYARGGNCNLFMLLESKPEYIGATIHYLDSGIDSGDIIYTVRPLIGYDDTLEILDAKAFLVGIDALLEVIIGFKSGRVKGVKQWTQGQLFLKRTGYEYSPYQKLRANNMIKAGVLAEYLKHKAQRDREVKLVSLTVDRYSSP